jgi:hypothetical protein
VKQFTALGATLGFAPKAEDSAVNTAKMAA